VRFIHTADVHLAIAEKSYCLAVLTEIGTVAASEKAGAILFAGDTFDSFQDALALRTDFGTWADGLPRGMQVLLLPGNHEELGRGANTLASLSFGSRVRQITGMPFEIITLGDTEFILFPFHEGYIDPATLNVPPIQNAVRVAVLHGTVAGMVYTGAGPGEAENSNIDPSIFTRLNASYVALGHIHGARTQTIGKAIVSYPGSARVWRKGEAGPRMLNIVDTAGGITHRQVVLASAGQYREHRIPLSLGGRTGALDPIVRTWSPADMVSIVLTGMVDDENDVVALKEELETKYSRTVRALEVRSEVEPAAGISSHPAAERFLALLAEQEGSADPMVWERARKLGLEAIAGRMGDAQ
jgi:DNA repair protein SbcD/Mre11